MSNQKYLYIVFSSTPYYFGSMIRFFTKNQYNHVSISFDQSLQMMYSFARYHQNAPMYGGLVRESCLRYKHGDKIARIKVCRIPITDEQKTVIRECIEQMKEQCCYNLVSVPCALMGRRYYSPHAYTCVEFLVSVLCRCKIANLRENKYYSVRDLENMFENHLFYEGTYNIGKKSIWGKDRFPEHCSRFLEVKKATGNVLRTLNKK